MEPSPDQAELIVKLRNGDITEKEILELVEQDQKEFYIEVNGREKKAIRAYTHMARVYRRNQTLRGMFWNWLWGY